MKLLIATTNPGKFEEAVSVLAESGLEIVGLKDFPNIQQVPETGETFEENAILKAKGYFTQTGVSTIADDGGLVVDALGGLPGVHSNRWLGHEATDAELANAVLERLLGVPQEKRTARLGGFIVFWDGTHLLTSECWLHGYIADRMMGEIRPGFSYRPLLIIPQFGKPYSELTPEEHQEVNFRRKNLAILKPKILECLNGK